MARCVAGNSFYRAGDHAMATTKYRKVSSPYLCSIRSNICKYIIAIQCCKYITLLRDTVGSTEDEEEKL